MVSWRANYEGVWKLAYIYIYIVSYRLRNPLALGRGRKCEKVYVSVNPPRAAWSGHTEREAVVRLPGWNHTHTHIHTQQHFEVLIDVLLRCHVIDEDILHGVCFANFSVIIYL